MRPPAFNLLFRPPHDPTPDNVLLAEFATRRDPVAFERLVRRHAGTVWDVCWRVLGNATDADDAFQATFLVLVRSARSAARVQSLGGWLYGVAFRVASKARVAAARRARREQAAARPEHTTDLPEMMSDLTAAVHAELSALPDRYRLAVLLCDLEGLSRTDAAERLGWKEGTLSGRLNRGRKRLAERLSARGITAAGAMLPVAVITPTASAVETVLAWAQTEIPGPTPAVDALATGAKRAMTLKLFSRLALVAVAVLSLLGVGLFGLLPAPKTNAAPVPKAERVEKEDFSDDRLDLLNSRRVQREIKMTAEQRANLLDGLDSLLEDRGVEVEASNGRIPPAYRDYQHFEQVYGDKRREFATTVITPGQLARLAQIEVQLSVEFAPMIPWVAEKMQLTNKQKEQVVDVLRGNEDFRPVGQAVELNRVAFKYKTPAEMRELVEQELTKEQRKVWVELAGEKLSFDVEKTRHDFNLRSKYRTLLRREGDVMPGGKGGK